MTMQPMPCCASSFAMSSNDFSLVVVNTPPPFSLLLQYGGDVHLAFSIAWDMARDLIDDVAAYLFEAEFGSAGLARVVNQFATTLINANAWPDVLVPTRGTLDGPQPGRGSKIVSRGGPRQPRRCSKIASRLSDPLLDRPNIRLVFIDVMGNGHCSSPKLGLVLN
jgi:hypothetical protein